MIPVEMKQEPPDFDERVRRPGNAFLALVPRPREKEWKGKEYWRRVIPVLREKHKCICAYTGLWIPKATGTPTIDHYIPRKDAPNLAYEWANFRLSCLLMNSRKKNFRDVLDPFIIKEAWFTIDFDTFMIHPNPRLPQRIRDKIAATLRRLKLNTDEACIEARREWFECYKAGRMDFSLLQEKAPFIAYEAERQGLVN